MGSSLSPSIMTGGTCHKSIFINSKKNPLDVECITRKDSYGEKIIDIQNNLKYNLEFIKFLRRLRIQ